MEFFERLKLVIGGESLRSFANKSGVSEGTLRTYISGKSEPSLQSLVRITLASKASIEWLATGEGPMRKPDQITDALNGFQNPEQHEATPEPGAYCYLPLYDVYASAGHGALIENEQVIDRLAFKQDWLKGEMGLTPENCCLIHVTGDSMEPTLHKKDVVMLDRSHTIYIEDGIYCLRLDGGLLIKRVQRISGNQVKIISDNPVYQPFAMDNDAVEFIGRIVWAGKRF